MMKFLALNSDLLARIILSLLSSFTVTDYFQKINFQKFNLVILNFELPSPPLYALCELFRKQAALCGNDSVLEKIRDSLLCATDRCIKVTSKIILPSVSRVNQFEMKDTCFEFAINVSRQGNNVKIKLNLKTNLQRFQS